MKRLTFSVAIGAMVWAFAPAGAFAQTTPGSTLISVSDDINADGVKLRGDGSVDDDQPNADGSISDDEIGDDGLKHRGDGSIDDDQTGNDDRGGGRENEVGDDHGGGRGHEAGDDRGGDNGRGRDREREDHDRGRDRERERDDRGDHGGRGHG